MPARNRYHRQLRRALEADGWTITHDPLHLKWGARDLLVDLGAERLLAAEKAERKVAVELQSFLGESDMKDLENALGQYTLYYDVLAEVEPVRELYLAIDDTVYQDLFQEAIPQLLLAKGRFRLVVFDPFAEVIKRWIP